MAKEKITDFYGKIIGFIDVDSAGNKTVTNFYGKILGYYKKNENITTDFYGRIVARGDASTGLVYKEGNK